jgi:hypothetical protein
MSPSKLDAKKAELLRVREEMKQLKESDEIFHHV